MAIAKVKRRHDSDVEHNVIRKGTPQRAKRDGAEKPFSFQPEHPKGLTKLEQIKGRYRRFSLRTRSLTSSCTSGMVTALGTTRCAIYRLKNLSPGRKSPEMGRKKRKKRTRGELEDAGCRFCSRFPSRVTMGHPPPSSKTHPAAGPAPPVWCPLRRAQRKKVNTKIRADGSAEDPIPTLRRFRRPSPPTTSLSLSIIHKCTANGPGRLKIFGLHGLQVK